jgi:Myb-like DNA-binding domain
MHTHTQPTDVSEIQQEWLGSELDGLFDEDQGESALKISNPKTQCRSRWDPLEDDVLFKAVIHSKREATCVHGGVNPMNAPDPEVVADETWNCIARFILHGRTPLQCYKRYMELISYNQSTISRSNLSSIASDLPLPSESETSTLQHEIESCGEKYPWSTLPSSMQQTCELYAEDHQVLFPCFVNLSDSVESELNSGSTSSNYVSSQLVHSSKFPLPSPSFPLTRGPFRLNDQDLRKAGLSQQENAVPHRDITDCGPTLHGQAERPLAKFKGSWTPKEDEILFNMHQLNGRKWTKIATHLPRRHAKQCRERFVNHLDPYLMKGEWTGEEEETLILLHAKHGNKWARISRLLPGRSENDLKNHWHSTIQRRYQGQEYKVSMCCKNGLGPW